MLRCGIPEIMTKDLGTCQDAIQLFGPHDSACFLSFSGHIAPSRCPSELGHGGETVAGAFSLAERISGVQLSIWSPSRGVTEAVVVPGG